MNTTPQGQENENLINQLVKIAGVIVAILGVPLALFKFIDYIYEKPVIALVVALIIAVPASALVARFGLASRKVIGVGWLVLIVGVVSMLWPKTITVEGTIRDTAGNPVSNEIVLLFDRSGRRYETKTDVEGYYQFTEVPSGNYKVRVHNSEVEGATHGLVVRPVQQNIALALVPTPTPTDAPIPTSTKPPSPTPTPSPVPTNTPPPTATSLPTPTEPPPTSSPTLTDTPAAIPMPPPVTIVDSEIHCTDNGHGRTEIIPVEPPRTIARIRLDLIRRATEFGYSLWEVEVNGPETGNTNLAIGGQTLASSAQDSFGCEGCFAEKTIDGDLSTRWSSDFSDPQWLEITLPGLQFVERIVLKWEAAYAKEYCVTVAERVISTAESTVCPYQADTDAETIIRLIGAESQAVLDENIGIIKDIFSEDATIWDAARDQAWNNPITRYTTLFANTDFIESVHFGIKATGPGITESNAFFTSGSRGTFVSLDNPYQEHDFNNEPGSDHWTFSRNNAGCWVITEFTFNAGHIPFPAEISEDAATPPMSTGTFFQNFEENNSTLPGENNYFWEAWFMTCSFSDSPVQEGMRAIRCDAQAEAGGNQGDHGGTVGINPASSNSIDLSAATTISVWVYDTQGNNSVELKLRDNNDTVSNGVWSAKPAVMNTWVELTWPLSQFTGVDKSQIKNIELYEWNDGTYYFDAVGWQ